MQKIAIIIPCYNEEQRLNRENVYNLAANTNADIYLCNDGSTDNTVTLLNSIAAAHPDTCFVIDYKNNTGKGNTIYSSVNQIAAKGIYTHIGYFDADFSTPVEEVIKLTDMVKTNPESFILGSRVKLLNHKIKRKTYRHYIGRFIITFINFKYKLKVYDTQCGAKIFPIQIARQGFTAPFKTSWLFDVEVLIRLQQAGLMKFGKEVPLSQWTDVDGSKLGWKSIFKVARELFIIYSY